MCGYGVYHLRSWVVDIPNAMSRDCTGRGGGRAHELRGLPSRGPVGGGAALAREGLSPRAFLWAEHPVWSIALSTLGTGQPLVLCHRARLRVLRAYRALQFSRVFISWSCLLPDILLTAVPIVTPTAIDG